MSGPPPMPSTTTRAPREALLAAARALEDVAREMFPGVDWTFTVKEDDPDTIAEVREAPVAGTATAAGRLDQHPIDEAE